MWTSRNTGLNLESSVFQLVISHTVDLAVHKWAKTCTKWTFRLLKLQPETRLALQLRSEEEDFALAMMNHQPLLWQTLTSKWTNYLERQSKTKNLKIAKSRHLVGNSSLLASKRASVSATTSTLHAFQLQTAQQLNLLTVALSSTSHQGQLAMILVLSPVSGSQNVNTVSLFRNASSKWNKQRDQKPASMTRDPQFTFC